MEACPAALHGAGSGLQSVYSRLVPGPDIRDDLGEKAAESDVEGTSIFHSDTLIIGEEQQSVLMTSFCIDSGAF